MLKETFPSQFVRNHIFRNRKSGSHAHSHTVRRNMCQLQLPDFFNRKSLDILPVYFNRTSAVGAHSCKSGYQLILSISLYSCDSKNLSPSQGKGNMVYRPLPIFIDHYQVPDFHQRRTRMSLFLFHVQHYIPSYHEA